MIIKKININNFRSYYGENNYEFSVNPKMPFTIVIGTNGGGKSSLMNAIQWCFYGKLASVKEEDESMPIRHIDCEDNEPYSVEIIFKHEDATYSLNRGWNKSVKDFVYLQCQSEDGDLGQKISNPELKINNILPEELKNWFFYRAEDALSELDLSGSQKFKDATRKIQGFTKIETLIQDFKEAEKKQRRNIDKLEKHKKEAASLNEQIEQCENEVEKLTKLNKELDDEINGLKEEKNGLKEELYRIPSAEPIQKEKEAKEAHKKTLTMALQDKEKEQNLFIGESLPAIILKNRLNKRNKAIVQEEENQITLEYPLGTKLYELIHKKMECICGRPFKKGSDEEKKIALLRKDAIHPVFNTRISKINSVITVIQGAFEAFRSSHEEKKDSISKINSQIKDLEDQIEEQNRILSSLGEKDQKISDLKDKIEQNESKTEGYLKEFAVRQIEIKDLKGVISTLESEKLKIGIGCGKLAGTDKLVKKIEILSKYAEEKLKRDEENSLKVVFCELNQLLEKFAYSNIRAEIDSKTYKLQTFESDGSGEKEKHLSGGELEQLKYFFITSILGLASKKTQLRLKYLSTPVACPLIIDAPFTKMDKDFISGAVEAITENLEQVVLFGLPTDFKKYEELIKNKVGKIYIAIKADKSSRKESKEKPSNHEIYGEGYEFVEYDNRDKNSKAVSQTKIVKVIL